jgi:hypothetical protein
MITQNYTTLTPAYGRDYKSGKAAKEDFLAKKDFILQPNGQCIGIGDYAPGVTVNIRYKQMRQVTTIKVP